MNAKQQLALYVLFGIAAYWVVNYVTGSAEDVVDYVLGLPGRAVQAIATTAEAQSEDFSDAQKNLQSDPWASFNMGAGLGDIMGFHP